MRLRERAAEDREVLGEDEDRAAVDRAPAGDDAVAGDLVLLHAEIGRAMLDEHVELLEGAFVEEDLDALAGRQLAAFVLGGDPGLAAADAARFRAGARVPRGRPSWQCPPRAGRQRPVVTDASPATQARTAPAPGP